MRLCLSLAMACAAVTLSAQSPDRTPECVKPYVAIIDCALLAAGIPPLQETVLQGREIRFLMNSGMFWPARLLRIRQTSDVVVGEHYLIWYAEHTDADIYPSYCAEDWKNMVSAICTPKDQPDVDWTSLLTELDSLGIENLDASPVKRFDCRSRMLADPSYGCPIRGDGFILSLEHKNGLDYWEYTFRDIPEPDSPFIERDQKISRLLTCAVGGAPKLCS